ncbi:hypothetical protein [Mycolicibacterium conceptionense]|uniref:hypothetical protein n=1 Tax=Mycolicibacterium conceptionense TaxID=451644 RepID=UPI0026D6E985
MQKTLRSNDDETTETTETTDAAPLAGHDEPPTEPTVVDADETTDTDDENDETESNTDTFSRKYVERLRRENAGYRERANRADELARRLHTALIQATGRLADPTDLPFDAAHLDDSDALETAIDELLTAKPHLASRRPFGDVGQGNRGGASEPPVNLADMLRARA